MVRAGRDAVHLDTFIDRGIITIGMSQHIGAEAIGDTRRELTDRTAKFHPDWNRQRLAVHTGQLFRFLSEMAVGDEVATYDPSLRRYVLGVVASEPRHDSKLIEDLPFIRNVRWDRRVARDSLTLETRNTLGAIQTIFRLNGDASSELRKRAVPLDAPQEIEPPKPKSVGSDKSLADLRDEVIEKASEFIDHSMTTTHDIVARLWNLCHTLRDDGVTYHQYVTELTYLLFLKMAQETETERGHIPAGWRWADLVAKDGTEQLTFYRELLIHLGTEAKGKVQAIYANANTSLRQPATWPSWSAASTTSTGTRRATRASATCTRACWRRTPTRPSPARASTSRPARSSTPWWTS
jgi:hypothetical protein